MMKVPHLPLSKTEWLITAIFFIAGLVYLLLPGPSSIDDFPALSNSLKSTEEGDTIQVPNVKAYFSDHFRDEATNFYRQSYQDRTYFPFPPLRLNHPPEYSYTAVKDQTRSTYLEEYVYPLRDNLFVNGFEPHYEDGAPRYQGATDIYVDGTKFDTKVTLRYYPTPIWARIVIWIGITIAILLLWKLTKQILKHE